MALIQVTGAVTMSSTGASSDPQFNQLAADYLNEFPALSPHGVLE
jgi:hypothetical protein